MLSSFERWVNFYEIALTARPHGGLNFSMAELVGRLAGIAGSPDALKLYDKDRFAMLLAAHAPLDDYNADVLLIRSAHSDAADPAFANLLTGELRTEPMQEGEGAAYSAHLVIGRDEVLPGSGRYPILLEEVPALGRSSVNPFLRSLARTCYSTDMFEDENGKERRCWPVTEILGVPSKALRDDLERGTIRGVTFVKRSNRANPTIDGLERTGRAEQESTLKVSLVPTGAYQRVLAACAQFAQSRQYDAFRLRYRRADNRETSQELPANQQDALDVLVNKKEKVKCQQGVPFPQARVDIDSWFSGQLAGMLS